MPAWPRPTPRSPMTRGSITPCGASRRRPRRRSKPSPTSRQPTLRGPPMAGNDAPPLTPPDCDLRDFTYMPLDVRRLLTSDTWLEAADDPKLGHVLICLWAEAWHQVPAASLTDNDRFAMCDGPEWHRLRDQALEVGAFAQTVASTTR